MRHCGCASLEIVEQPCEVSHSVLHDGHACAVATARAARRAGHLGQGDKEGPRVGGQVARGRQVAVHLPALRKLLQPVVELAADDHLRPGAPAARRTRRPAVTAPAAAAQPPVAARAGCAARGARRRGERARGLAPCAGSPGRPRAPRASTASCTTPRCSAAGTGSACARARARLERAAGRRQRGKRACVRASGLVRRHSGRCGDPACSSLQALARIDGLLLPGTVHHIAPRLCHCALSAHMSAPMHA